MLSHACSGHATRRVHVRVTANPCSFGSAVVLNQAGWSGPDVSIVASTAWDSCAFALELQPRNLLIASRITGATACRCMVGADLIGCCRSWRRPR